MKLQKETESSDARHGRWYEDACGTAFAMELVGERWSLLVIRELMLGPRRFSKLKNALNGISAKVLTERLESLERAGAVVRRTLPAPANVQVYELTEWGYQAKPVMGAYIGPFVYVRSKRSGSRVSRDPVTGAPSTRMSPRGWP